jgi:uncharacterized protein (DUF697 family)
MGGALIEDGKAYAQAEIGLARLRVELFAAGYREAAIFGTAAALFGLVGLITLFVTIALSLATLLGPLAGGLIATLLAFGIAGLLGWLAKKRLDARNG